MSAVSRGWRVELDRVWDVLGPFPIHAREQHFLSPAFPLDLSLPISTAIQHPTSLTNTGYTSWSQTTADPNGTIRVSHPSVPWSQIRVTEGWAGLQHANVLRGWLSVYPPPDLSRDTSEPLLRTELLQGAFFTILPPPDSLARNAHAPEWHYGNIYTLERAPVQLVRFPVSPGRGEEWTKYELIICAPYEIRLFGDPSAYSSPHPVLTLNFSVSLQFPCSPAAMVNTDETRFPTEDVPLQHVIAHSITPHIVDGTPFGDAAGVGIQCLDFGGGSEEGQGYWSVIRARLLPTSEHLPTSLSVALLDEEPVRIAPTQTRVIPLQLCVSLERIPEVVKQLDIELTCLPSVSLRQLATKQVQPGTLCDSIPIDLRSFVLRATLPLVHIPLWTKDKHVPIHASCFFAKSMPTLFSVKPPMEAFGDSQGILGQYSNTSRRRGNEPVLALHGAGVEILSQSFWADSLLRQKYAWVVMPQGGTAWGLDWHGPSTADAFAVVSALSRILSTSGSGRWVKWGFDVNTRVILMGHSNGGQGAWYMASRWPDRVLAVVPAAGYIKSQAYVPWSMSRFAHFADPTLRDVLDSSLTPDDNDLFLGNLVGKPVLALHGGADDNVPPWHTREQVEILKTWDPNVDVTYHEDPGQPHWYFEILFNDRVQAFLDRVYFSSSPSEVPHNQGLVNQEGVTTSFTLTVAVPTESGSLNGWQIHALAIPGVLGRLRVVARPDGQVSVQTSNVAMFSLDLDVWAASCGGIEKASMLVIDNNSIPVNPSGADRTILFKKDANVFILPCQPVWKIFPSSEPLATIIHRLRPPPQRLQAILSSHAPLALLVPSLAPSPELSAALRIAHALFLFHALDARIVSMAEVEAADETTQASIGIRQGNLVIIGCAGAPHVRRWLHDAGKMWSYDDGVWRLTSKRFDRPSSAILFCQPHPYDVRGIALFVQSTDPSGLERAVRLFPIRTGVPSPDWLVVDGRADAIGAAGVQGAGVYGWCAHGAQATGTWVLNERMSWLD